MADRLFVSLSYADAPAAIGWLEAVGFTLVRRQDDGERVVHAELRRGDAVVMVASDDAPYQRAPLVGRSTGLGLYLLVDQVDEVFDAAVRAGADAVIPPEDTEWGTRRARVVDPGGVEWSFGTYEPGAQW
ncbi:VOC family protein [Mumia sp. DW29H23]|uniref:VOC family protein n=1 Tax=Mumia sp. DW29H23 TaxID=3421241 RepID=UPI003D69EF98